MFFFFFRLVGLDYRKCKKKLDCGQHVLSDVTILKQKVCQNCCEGL